MNSDLAAIVSLRKRFVYLSNELAKVELKIEKLEGFWIFQAHTYTKEKLLDDPIMDKLVSALMKIADDVENWAYSGEIGEHCVSEYFKMQNDFIAKVEGIQTKIIKRPNTNWENAAAGVKIIFNLIIECLPIINKIKRLGGGDSDKKLLN